MATYSEKLKDPRWQKKRLKILKRDEFTCRHCDDKSETLHVHHYEYIRGKEPWDYEDENFITLCATCHLVAGHINFNFKVNSVKIKGSFSTVVIAFTQASDVMIYTIKDNSIVSVVEMTGMEGGDDNYRRLFDIMTWWDNIDKDIKKRRESEK